MRDPQDRNPQSQEMAAEFSQLFEQAFDQQRALWEQAARYSRDESLRFATLRLKRANQTLENVQGGNGFKILAQIQQAWLRDLVQDYTAQSVRCSEMLSRLAASAMVRAVDVGREAMDEGQEVLRQGREVAGENLDTMRQADAEMIRANHEAIHAGAESIAPPIQEYH
jgi:hypothetical protein